MTMAGHLPGVEAESAKVRPKKAGKTEAMQDDQPKEDIQVCATTPRPKSKGPNRSTPPPNPTKESPKTTKTKPAETSFNRSAMLRNKGKSKHDSRNELHI